MIPKIIHYCWFGGGIIPDTQLRYIENWKKLHPDYQIIRWDESNFDVSTIDYIKDAYDAKKFAFVCDYVRQHAVHLHGGIYLDTDVEVLKPFDDLLHHEFFIGFEDDHNLEAAIFGSVPAHPVLQRIMTEFHSRKFYLPLGKIDTKPLPQVITQIFVEYYELKKTNVCQHLADGISVFTKDYFTCKDWETKEIFTTKNSYCIHNFAASWHDDVEKSIRNKFGPEVSKNLMRVIRVKRRLGRIISGQHKRRS